MDADEREIFHFLKTWGSEFVGAKEIARRAGGRKRFADDPEWAKTKLGLMTERGILEGDSLGRYRIKPQPRKNKNNRWISPDIAKILQESGVKVEPTEGEVSEDEYYDQL